MAVPTYDQMIFPLVVVLAEAGGEIAIETARERLAAAMRVTPEERAELLPSGQQALFDNRAGWAHDRLKRAGLSTSARRGFWRLLPAGMAWRAAHPKGPSAAELSAMSHGVKKTRPRLREPGTPATAEISTGIPAVSEVVQTRSPKERIEDAVTELRRLLADDLMEKILDGTPTFFETLVLDLLHRMGYGVSRADIQQVGGPGDGGIDGIIALDKLGLQKVYIQAKRWRDASVGRKEIHSFYGALSERKARMGVFITTSTFTHDAKASARGFSDSIALIDGERLTELMIDHGVGVSVDREVRIVRLDTDYFLDE